MVIYIITENNKPVCFYKSKKKAELSKKDNQQIVELAQGEFERPAKPEKPKKQEKKAE